MTLTRTRTGNLISNIMLDSEPKVPAVGMGITVLMWTDRMPGTIISVSASGKSFKYQADTATRIDENGMSDAQTYEYGPDPSGPNGSPESRGE
jgi:hypothetical protein